METTRVPQIYFDKAIWPGYVEHNKDIPTRSDIYILDGLDSPEHLLKQSLIYISAMDSSSPPDDTEARSHLVKQLNETT